MALKKLMRCFLISLKNNVTSFYYLNPPYILSFVLINFLSLFVFKGFAQSYQVDTNDGLYLNISVGGAKFRNQDFVFSSQEFAGAIPFFRSLIELVNEKNHHVLHIGYAAGKLNTYQPPKAHLNMTYLHADYIYSRKIGKVNAGKWRNELGAGITVFYNSRRYEDFINVNEGSELVSSLSGTFQTSYILSESGGWSLSNRIFFPIVSLVTLPELNRLSSQVVVNSGKSVRQTSFVFIPDYFRINNQFQVEKSVGYRHKLMLAYTWDIYSIKSSVDKRQAFHLLAFVYQIKI